MDARRRRAHPDDEAQAHAHRREILGRDRGAVRGLNSAAPNESLELGRKLWELFNAGRIEDMIELLTPDHVLATDPSWPGGGEYRGIDAYRRFMTQFLEAFGGIRFQSESEPETIGDLALFHGHWVGLGAASGIETVSQPFWVVTLAHDGKVAEARFFFSESKAREHATSLT